MRFLKRVVSNGSKILIWKQITTKVITQTAGASCFQWFKDTNLKANHNGIFLGDIIVVVVSNGSKILIWKQITTNKRANSVHRRCFQWFKDTNLKANHNLIFMLKAPFLVVSNGSKILIWKQITTVYAVQNLDRKLFPMVQRY